MVGGTVYMLDNSVTGEDANNARPIFVDSVIPADDSTVLSQSTVGIDVDSRYDAYLIVNDIAITNQANKDDEDGLLKSEETGVVQYNPGPGMRVESLETPKTCITAMVWEKISGPETAEPVTWCFNVT